MFFTVLGADGVRRLWRTDGTAPGTVPVPGADALAIRANLLADGGIDLFEAPDAEGFTHLWSTDGDRVGD